MEEELGVPGQLLSGECHWLEIGKVSETYRHFQQYVSDLVEESDVTGENNEPSPSCDRLLSNEVPERHYP